MHSGIPIVIRQLAAFKHRVLAKRYPLTTMTALVSLPVWNPLELDMTALRADHMLFLQCFKMIHTSILVTKQFVKR